MYSVIIHHSSVCSSVQVSPICTIKGGNGKVNGVFLSLGLKLKSERIAALNDMTERHSRELDDIKEAHSKAMNVCQQSYFWLSLKMYIMHQSI